MSLRIQRLVTSGTFSLDGGTWDVDNNVWIVGNDEECVVIDPAHDAKTVTAAGHSPGSVSFHLPTGPDGGGTVFSGDTLFQGGPGATGRSYSDFPTIIESIRTWLLPLPAETVVRTGHGDSTTIGAEAPHLDEWIARGH